ncbi:CLIP domain-containing serine protease B8-like [Topomyia yanbarensis]|uniref:CLIP domain-containing serine protease B8-like n=1 Tax=Topomyia yanbarensis TaxID=2498891 RepID=UPI00273B45FC|nr:CLIP domain-containing serine protease B8-like [Topomyia yanbarensis]
MVLRGAVILCAFLLLPAIALTFTDAAVLPCEIPNENTAGYCISPDACRPYQQLKNGAAAAKPETGEFLKRLSCSPRTVCCTRGSAYANPRVPMPVQTADLIANCGVEATGERIFGGEITKIDEFPWLALLFYHSKDTGMVFPSCGGVLVAKQWVLTAGHCVTGRGYRNTGSLKFVRLGENNLETEVDCDKDGDCADRPVNLEVEQIIPHPDYVSTSWDKYNDVALLKLAKEAPYTDFVRHICLPSYYNLSEENAVSKYVAAGWGQTDLYDSIDSIPSKIKLKVSLPHVELSRCQAVYSNYSVRIAASQICAGGRKAQDTCRGDSGSPLMYYSQPHGRWFAYGIVSRGPSQCGTEGVPSIYTSLFTFDDWVSSTMAAN